MKKVLFTEILSTMPYALSAGCNGLQRRKSPKKDEYGSHQSVDAATAGETGGPAVGGAVLAFRGPHAALVVSTVATLSVKCLPVPCQKWDSGCEEGRGEGGGEGRADRRHLREMKEGSGQRKTEWGQEKR